MRRLTQLRSGGGRMWGGRCDTADTGKNSIRLAVPHVYSFTGHQQQQLGHTPRRTHISQPGSRIRIFLFLDSETRF